MNGDTPAPSASDSGQPDSPWQYKSSGDPQAELYDGPVASPHAFDGTPEVAWSASEFIDHHKSPLWYVGLGGVTAAVITIIFLWTRDVVSVVAVAIMAILVGIVAKRKPRVMEYRLDGQGLSIGPRLYAYSDYKSFTITAEGPMVSIVLFPLKRFMPPLSVYFDIADEERITDVLSRYLPMETPQHDIAEQFGRKIRF